jgi:hypothetical protein
MKKRLLFSGLLLWLLTFSCFLIAVKALNNPQIPNFTINLADRSYDVPPVYDVNSFTGQNETIRPGYHVEKKLIEVKIENQYSYSDYGFINSSQVKVYYDIRYKGHFDDTWIESSSISNLAPSDGDYTTVDFGYGSNNPGGFLIWIGYIPPDGQVDFQVQAFLGYYRTTTVQTGSAGCWRNETTSVFEKTGLSGWSATQTITVDPTSPNETGYPTNDAATSIAPAPTAGIVNNTTPVPTQNWTPTQTSIPAVATSLTETPTPSVPLILEVVIGFAAISIIAVIALLAASRRAQKKSDPTGGHAQNGHINT